MSEEILKDIKLLLEQLKVKYEVEDGPVVTIPLFGVRIRFDQNTHPEDEGWFIVQYEKSKSLSEIRDEIVFALVRSGYVAYIRDDETTGSDRAFQKFIIDWGWGDKIIAGRLREWEGKPRYRYLYERNKRFQKAVMASLITHYPNFFDSF